MTEKEEIEYAEAIEYARVVKIYKAALRRWGGDLQTLVCLEEMSELQKELCKRARGADNSDAIAEEIADVLIMLDQMALLHNCGVQVEKWRNRKLNRLEERLNEEMEES